MKNYQDVIGKREIRFKAWDKYEKKMHKSFTFNDLYGYEGELNAVVVNVHPYSNEPGRFCISRHGIGNMAYPQLKTDEGVDENLIIMQHTGIKDKNGKKIYEGNIIKTNDGNVDVVVIRNGCSETLCECIPGNEWREYEVIGNIFENPKLLKNI